MATENKKRKEKNAWYIYTEHAFTDTVIAEMKRSCGKHDEDYFPTKRLWRVTLEEIARLMSGKNYKDLDFEIRLQKDGGEIIPWQFPTSKKNEYKLILALHPLTGNFAKQCEKIMKISLEESSDRVIVYPAYVVNSMMLDMVSDPSQKKIQLNRGFKAIMRMILLKVYHEIWIYGDSLSPGMQYIIIFARLLRIPIKLKNKKLQKDLDAL